MPALSYHLGKNPELIDELQTLKPVQIARKLFCARNEPRKTPKKTATHYRHRLNRYQARAILINP